MTTSKAELTAEIVKLMERNRELSRNLAIADDQVDWMSKGFVTILSLLASYEKEVGKLPLRLSFLRAAALRHNTEAPSKQRDFMENWPSFALMNIIEEIQNEEMKK